MMIAAIVAAAIVVVIATVDRVTFAVRAAMDANAASVGHLYLYGRSRRCRMERHGLGDHNADDADAEDEGKKLTHLLTPISVIDVSLLSVF